MSEPTNRSCHCSLADSRYVSVIICCRNYFYDEPFVPKEKNRPAGGDSFTEAVFGMSSLILRKSLLKVGININLKKIEPDKMWPNPIAAAAAAYSNSRSFLRALAPINLGGHASKLAMTSGSTVEASDLADYNNIFTTSDQIWGDQDTRSWYRQLEQWYRFWLPKCPSSSSSWQ